MVKRTSSPGKIHLRIVEAMKRFPDGISGGQIRQALEKEGLRPEDQTHLDRRKRDLKKWFVIEKIKRMEIIDGKKRAIVLYKYLGERKVVSDPGDINRRIRAEVIGAARGRCQMCGRTIETHGITLVVDHKKPRNWGGLNSRDNLWAICDECNSGKKAFFSSLDVAPDTMKKILAHRSVHVRIGELLKAVGVGNATSSPLLEVVADQDDWQKRLRELRYPVIGWKIEKRLHKGPSGRMQADYVLKSYRDWPEDPTGAIRQFERQRGLKNKHKDD